MSCVDQRAGTGAGRVRRLLSRALLVFGGALAGSAAAWALSTAPASAQIPVDHDVVAEVVRTGPHGAPATPHRSVEAVLAPVRTAAIGEAAHGLGTALRTPKVRESAPPELGRVADELRGTVSHVSAWLKPGAEPAPVDVVGGTVAHRATETTPAATAVPVPAGTPVVHGVFTKFSRTWPAAPRQPVTALPVDHGPALPGDPSGLPSMPVAPLGAPAHCACGGDGSGNPGGGSGPLTAASTHHTDTAVARALFPATERNSVRPGKQPGSTPD
jgi:hypothetical protein